MPKVRQEDEVLMPTKLPKSKTVVLQISPNNEVVVERKSDSYWCRSICWICCFSLTFVLCYALAFTLIGSAVLAVLFLKIKDGIKEAIDIKDGLDK